MKKFARTWKERPARPPWSGRRTNCDKSTFVSDVADEAHRDGTSPWTSACGLARRRDSPERVRRVASCPSCAEMDLPPENATTQCAIGHRRSAYRHRLCHARHPLDLVRDLPVRVHHHIPLGVLLRLRDVLVLHVRSRRFEDLLLSWIVLERQVIDGPSKNNGCD